MGLNTGETIVQGDFIQEPTGGNDENKVPKLGANNLINPAFIGGQEISLTAEIDISANKLVGVNTQGKIAEAVKTYETITLPSGLQKVYQIIQVDTDTYVMHFEKGHQEAFVVAFTVSAGVIMFGTAVDVSTYIGRARERKASIAKIGTNKFAITGSHINSPFYPYVIVGSVSGTTITMGTQVSIATNSSYEMCVCADVGDDVVLFGANYGASNFEVRHGAITVSGTTPTVHTISTAWENVDLTLNDLQAVRAVRIASGKALFVGGVSGYGYVATWSGSAYAYGNEVDIFSGGVTDAGNDNYDRISVVSPSDNVFVVRFNGKLVSGTVSGTTITVADRETITAEGGELVVSDGVIYEYTETAIYKITLDGSNNITRTKLWNNLGAISNNVAGVGTSTGIRIVIGANSTVQKEYHTGNFVGYIKNGVVAEANADINVGRLITGQSGLVAGQLYEVLAGELSATEDETKTYKAVAVSATEAVIV